MERRIDEAVGEGYLEVNVEIKRGESLKKERVDSGAKEDFGSRRLKSHRSPLVRSLDLGQYRLLRA